MKRQELFIGLRFPGLNEIIADARSHKMKSAKQKAYWTGIVKILAKSLKPIDKGAMFIFTWHEKSRLRDPDNITAGQKFIFDGLVAAGILKNDGWSQIISLRHEFQVGPTEGVSVEIWETTN